MEVHHRDDLCGRDLDSVELRDGLGGAGVHGSGKSRARSVRKVNEEVHAQSCMKVSLLPQWASMHNSVDLYYPLSCQATYATSGQEHGGVANNLYACIHTCRVQYSPRDMSDDLRLRTFPLSLPIIVTLVPGQWIFWYLCAYSTLHAPLWTPSAGR